MTASLLLLFLLAGALSGVFAGLFGVGGGVLIVPLLIFILAGQGFAAETLTHVAIGSSLATISLTSLSSAYAHYQKGALRWDLFRWLAPGLAVGAVLGGLTAGQLEGETLRVIFGALMLAAAARMLYNRLPAGLSNPPPPAALAGSGSVIGWFSALLGIGGGILTTPFLTHFRVPIKQAVATSASCGVPIALCGTFCYVAIGWQQTGLPAGTTGYVYWPASLGIALGGVPGARWGAHMAHRISSLWLRRAFAFVIFATGVALIC